MQPTAQRIGNVIVGQEEVVDGAIIGLLADGHVLLEGIPGLGKTLLVRTLADALHVEFSRIQFTPDLMPADIVGTHVLREDETGGRRLVFEPGPIFANLLLADEINRATPKTQSALLEAMQRRRSPSAARRTSWGRPSSSSPPRTRWKWRGRTRCPRRSSTASCSSCG